MDIRRAKKLTEPLEESSVDELEIREDEESVRISRHSKVVARPVYVQVPAFTTPVAAPAPAVAAPVAAAVESAPAAPKLNGSMIHSPMIDTFYRTASPTSTNFVEVSQSVKKGDILCIVKAMKMMSHIEAEVNNTIESILVENDQPAEFDQPLFTIV